MKTLVVAATAGEIAPVEAALRARRDVDVLVTGVGMVATAARCSRRLAQGSYDFAVNLGLCGSFDSSLTPGVVVHVVSDRLSELGAEDGDQFLPIESLPLSSDHLVENQQPPANVALAWLPRVSGITVNTVHGDEAAIAAVVARCRPQVESMEGAAFMYACRLAGVPFAQVRAVSNMVERRNRANWKMSEAVDALAAVARAILQLA
jgi:futalosine hydrolase